MPSMTERTTVETLTALREQNDYWAARVAKNPNDKKAERAWSRATEAYKVAVLSARESGRGWVPYH